MGGTQETAASRLQRQIKNVPEIMDWLQELGRTVEEVEAVEYKQDMGRDHKPVPGIVIMLTISGSAYVKRFSRSTYLAITEPTA
jgi:hypothetical protein